MITMRLKNKKAIITGGNKGIGRAIALGFAEQGCELLITFNSDLAAAKEVAGLLNKQGKIVHLVKLDITNPADIKNLMNEVKEKFGVIDILVNNAAKLTRSDFRELSLDEWDAIFNTNLRGPFLLMQEAANIMISHKRPGSIINISSISDRIATTGLSHYQAAKAGLSMLSKGCALELATYGIRVNTLCPGLTQTNINQSQWTNDTPVWQSRVMQIPLGRAGLPVDQVGAAIFLASDESMWMTGAEIVIDGGRSII